MGEGQTVPAWGQLAHPLLCLPPETHRSQNHGRLLRVRRSLWHNHGPGESSLKHELGFENVYVYFLHFLLLKPLHLCLACECFKLGDSSRDLNVDLLIRGRDRGGCCHGRSYRSSSPEPARSNEQAIMGERLHQYFPFDLT